LNSLLCSKRGIATYIFKRVPGDPLGKIAEIVSRLFSLLGRAYMAGEEEKQEGKGFTVQDRRRFSPETGEAREVPEEPKGFTISGGSESVGESQSKTQ